jgi:hypothetical protein
MAVLLPEKEPPVPIGYKAEANLNSVEKGKFFTLPGH